MDPQVLARLDELEDALRQHEAQVKADSDGDGGDGAVPDDRVGGGTDHHRTDGGYPRPVQNVQRHRGMVLLALRLLDD